MTDILEEIAKLAKVKWFDYQLEAFDYWEKLPEPKRMCLYYRTGAGKSLTALSLLKLDGHKHALIIAPPATHKAWRRLAHQMEIVVDTISHAKFRQKNYKTSRTLPIIADEFHLFGGQKGVGWRKFSRTARGLQAPIILASATPNYNDAERVYCIQAVLDPPSVHGGYIQFLYKNCITRHNPFGIEPYVEGFLHYDSAADYLQDIPGVVYVPDNVSIEPINVLFQTTLPQDFHKYNVDRSRKRIMASSIEKMHREKYLFRVDAEGNIRKEILDVISAFMKDEKPTLIFSASAVLANQLAVDLQKLRFNAEVVTGNTSKKEKERLLELFKDRKVDILIGTATLATGVDGIDKVCDSLIIFDDTKDSALRRQLMGRILPRGADADASVKQVLRYVFFEE